MVVCSLLTTSHVCTKKELKQVLKNLEDFGFNKIEDLNSKDSFLNHWGGSPKERTQNLYSAWNSNSDAIICFKGGSGISHFLPLVNIKKMKGKKLFVGYSDITLLLNFLQKKKKIITFHGPNGLSKFDKQTSSSLKKALNMETYGISFEKEKCFNIPKNNLKGKTIGGNLERLVETLFYTKLNFKNKILFLEEVGHTEYKIFNLLMFLKTYQKGFKPKAILFGNLGIKNKKLMTKLIKEIFPDIPLITNLPFGHQIPKITIPIGANCEIDFKKEKIKFSFTRKHKKYAIKI
jgi:muramoyltetrapeptide carboxypeptidase